MFKKKKKIDYIDKIENLTTQDFKEQVFDFDNESEWKFKGVTPTIIDFYADWCQPCKALAHTLEKVKKTYKKKINILKVNIDEEPELSSMLQIQSIPTLLFIPLEGTPEVTVGILPEDKINSAVKTVLKID